MSLSDLFFIGNRVDSKTVGLQPLKLPKSARPQKRYTEYTVPGRSGKLRTSDGSYDEIDKQVTFMCLEENVEIATKWLSEITEICTSADPLRAYTVTPGMSISTTMTSAGLYEFSVTFKCYPLSKDYEEQTYEIISTGQYTPYLWLTNPSTIDAYPSFEIFGNGTVKIIFNENALTIADVDGWAFVEGGEAFVAYDNAGSILNRVSLTPATDVGFLVLPGSADGFPRATFVCMTGADRIIITPNWRYV